MLTMKDRSVCDIANVSDILSSDEKEIVLDTNDGMLMIKGKNLKIVSYTNDSMHIEGKINSFTYA